MKSVLLTYLFRPQLDLPWWNRHCVAILVGVGALWAAFSRQPIQTRNGEPLPSQRFLKVCFAILGVAMISLSLWGLWLKTP
jgi:hypothetical protein